MFKISSSENLIKAFSRKSFHLVTEGDDRILYEVVTRWCYGGMGWLSDGF